MPKKPPLQPRKSPIQPRSRHTVDAVIEATARVLSRHGYAGMSTNRVAEAAGVSIGSLYQYFPNKDSLIVALNRRHSRRLCDVIDETLTRHTGALRMRLRALVHAIMAVHLENPELERMLETDLSYLDPRPEDDEGDLDFAGRIRTFLEEHRAEICVADLSLANHVLLHQIRDLVHGMLFDYTGPSSMAEREETITDALVGFLTYSRPAEALFPAASGKGRAKAHPGGSRRRGRTLHQ
jgi:AcrR family transcriptional regulator